MANLIKFHSPQSIRDGWSDKYEWARRKVINRELQDYAEKNDRNSRIVKDGDDDVLELIAIQETIHGDFSDNSGNAWKEQKYSSAVFISQNQHYVETGQYVEFDCKLPAEIGCFPAGWLLDSQPRWQKSEIDIFEGIYDVLNNKIHHAFHSHTEEKSTYQKLGVSVNVLNPTSQFNKYGVHITDTDVIYYINRVETERTSLHDHEKNLKWYFLLNLAIAGEGSWAAGQHKEPYGWDKAVLSCKGISVFDGVPEADAASSNETMEVIADVVPTPASQPSVQVMADEMASTDNSTMIVTNSGDSESLYNESTTIAKVLYDLARNFGGKL